jgi:hypothetical protein
VKVEGYLFAFIAVFLAPVDVVYWFTSHDPTGTTALALGVCLGTLVGSGEIGFFSPYSWAPLWCALSAAVIFAGVVFGWWMVFLGAAFAVPAVGSMVFEYYSDDMAS